MSEDQKQNNEMDQLISDDMWVYGYTRIDNGVIYCKQITDSEFRTYCVVRSLVNSRKAVAWPSFDTIAELSGHHKRTAQRNVARLEELDLIKKIPRNGSSNQFVVKKMQNSSVLKEGEKIQEYIEKHGLDEKPADPPKEPKEPKEPKADPIPYKQIMETYNKIAGKNLLYTTERYRKNIRGRWNEMKKAGMDHDQCLAEFMYVLDVKAKHWIGDEVMEKHYHPDTLFCGKFGNYRQQTPEDKFGNATRQSGQAQTPAPQGSARQNQNKAVLDRIRQRIKTQGE